MPMYEMAMAEGIFAVVMELAQDQKVRRVSLRIGRLHAVVPESMQFSFALLAENSLADGAILDIEEVPISLLCTRCGETTQSQGAPFNCSRCGLGNVEIVGGEELTVEAIELDDGSVLHRPLSDQEALEAPLKEHVRTEHHQ